MTQRYHNPFSNARLVYPIDQGDYYNRFAKNQSSLRVDESPFPRMIDFWWAGLLIAARNELKPIDLNEHRTRYFATGAILDSDPWRIQYLRLIALHFKGEPDTLTNHAAIIALANGLAAAGVPCVVGMLTGGDEPPIWNLSNGVERLLAE